MLIELETRRSRRERLKRALRKRIRVLLNRHSRRPRRGLEPREDPLPARESAAPLLPELEVVRHLCRQSFYEFVKEFWDVIIPDPPRWNWHIKYLCDQMQKLALRVMQGLPKEHDLVVNISPGTTKSTIVSVMFPAWVWTVMPHARFICCSHGERLGLRLSTLCRRVIKSQKYQQCFDVMMRPDQDTKGFFANTGGGERYTVGSGSGAVMGNHAHFILIDDPIDPESVLSEVELERVNDWIDQQLSGRKVDKAITVTVLIMQRLHQSDPTSLMLKGKKVKHIKLPATLEYEVKPAPLARYYKNGLMDPVRLGRDVLDEVKNKPKGDYIFCTPGFSPILMENFKEKMIEDVRPGDVVVGYGSGGRGTKTGLLKSVVKKVHKGVGKVYKYTMASGRTVYCTADHKWWTRRTGPGRSEYLPAKVGRNLFSVYQPIGDLSISKRLMWAWLAGLIDGEGSCKHDGVAISQSPSANPEVCEKLERVLRLLGIEWCQWDGVQRNKKDGSPGGLRRVYALSGGRSLKMKLLNYARLAKKDQVLASLWNRAGRFVSDEKDEVVSVEYAGKMPVYGLTTSSGNYVAWGYASQNSGQYGQEPVPPGGGMFKITRLKRGHPPRRFKCLVRYWDKAGTAMNAGKRGWGSWTVGVLMGLGHDGRVWVLDVIRFMADSFEREKVIRQVAKRDGRHVIVGMEQEPGSGGKESAESTARRLVGFRIRVLRAVGDKERRADPISQQVNMGNVYLPEEVWSNGGWTGWAKEYVEEMKYFPFSTYKDQIDASAGALTCLTMMRRTVGGMKRSKNFGANAA